MSFLIIGEVMKHGRWFLRLFTELKKGVDITTDRAYNIHVDLKRGINSVVECHLAKVKVASPNLVSRSTKKPSQSRRLFYFLNYFFQLICLQA